MCSAFTSEANLFATSTRKATENKLINLQKQEIYKVTTLSVFQYILLNREYQFIATVILYLENTK